MKMKTCVGYMTGCLLAFLISNQFVCAGEIYSMEQIVPSVGVASILEEEKEFEEYVEAAKQSAVYGYSNVGIAQVDNHLNIREAPEEGAKLVGKMSNNSACDILADCGDWYQIRSGKVEGYACKDYLITGIQARLLAETIVEPMARAITGGLRVRQSPSTESEIITQMAEGETLEVVGQQDGWIEVLVDDEHAFISAEYAEIKKELPTAITMTELLYGEGVSDVRVDICQYAKQYIGNRYVWGGTSLTKGADCSGFTMSVFKQFGISLPHSSVAQSKMGQKVSLSEAKAGDLVFYSSKGRVNHVALYLGNGQVVHASNPKTGIRISAVGYRSISGIRNIIQD